jgi:arsenate reductase
MEALVFLASLCMLKSRRPAAVPDVATDFSIDLLPMHSIKANPLLPSLNQTVEVLSKQFGQIAPERRIILKQLADFIQTRRSSNFPVFLNFICTHNSRRSHIAQLWAQAAAHYYNVPNVVCFSGGTEATAFNPRAVKAMEDAGFSIIMTKEGENPVYEVRFAEGVAPVVSFSKKYDDPINDNEGFAAVMTCSHADENCPVVAGAIARIALTYDDPKHFDGTPLEEAKYAERVKEIGRELLFTFSQVKV